MALFLCNALAADALSQPIASDGIGSDCLMRMRMIDDGRAFFVTKTVYGYILSKSVQDGSMASILSSARFIPLQKSRRVTE